MSGSGFIEADGGFSEAGFKEPSLAEAYLLMVTSRILGGYYRKYIESLGLMAAAGLTETSSQTGRNPRGWPTFQGIYVK